MFEQEFLNIIMIRNLNSDAGRCSGTRLRVVSLRERRLCNGTWLRVVSLRERSIEATIMSGPFKGKTVFIPCITFSSEDDDKEFPFKLRRKQFPVVPAFAHGQFLIQGDFKEGDQDCCGPKCQRREWEHTPKNIIYREIIDL
ncbi:LOW QUALITY PROTEIN: Helitron helicase [Phytophthora megakarya]|uniref:Helitron helicase n=1 Tax=Phytophthora megakarya TaxID=4795 RepID=A0A225V5K1_9STRA|nr:LOW QUALITY PROTEIN: Helitron helicase [Phytophthora megakarya]